jgi:hypothetical protein
MPTSKFAGGKFHSHNLAKLQLLLEQMLHRYWAQAAENHRITWAWIGVGGSFHAEHGPDNRLESGELVQAIAPSGKVQFHP